MKTRQGLVSVEDGLGPLIAVGASILQVGGVDFGADEQGQLADIAVTLAGAVGGLLALYGRLVATSAIGGQLRG